MDWSPVVARIAQAVVLAALAAVAGGGVGQQIGLSTGHTQATGTFVAQEASNAALQSVIASLAVDLEECEGR